MIDDWCHLQNLGLEDFFVGVSKYVEAAEPVKNPYENLTATSCNPQGGLAECRSRIGGINTGQRAYGHCTDPLISQAKMWYLGTTELQCEKA